MKKKGATVAAGHHEAKAHGIDRGDAGPLELRHLRTFKVVADTGNFTRAANELGYSQSTVTTHIKALERILGTELFERSRFSKQIALTEAGKRIREYSERLLALADETVQHATS